jgi:hypothetical protein
MYSYILARGGGVWNISKVSLLLIFMMEMNIQNYEETLPVLLRLICRWNGYRNCLTSDIKIEE